MRYAAVKQSVEVFFLTNWVSTPNNTIQFDAAPFNSEPFTEYVQFTIQFGDMIRTSLASRCFRQFGMVMVSIKVRPGTGAHRKLVLAGAAAILLNNAVVRPVAPLVAPAAKFRESSLYDESVERDGWVMAQVSCPFYYDLEI